MPKVLCLMSKVLCHGRALVWLFAALLSGAAAGVGVLGMQDIQFKKAGPMGGQWQFVFLTVEPEGTADEVFADWPVEAVGMFDAQSFRRYEQWSAGGSTEGANLLPTPMWVRGDAGASGFNRVPGNTVYFFKATNDVKRTVYGAPLAQRTCWHATDANTPANYVGVSIAAGEKVALADYFAGCDAAPEAVRVGGIDPTGPQRQLSFGELTAADGEVFAVEAKYVSDWSGSMYVTPERGVDFGTNDVLASVNVRNDGATNSVFTLFFEKGMDGAGRPQFNPEFFLWRVSSIGGDGAWHRFSESNGLSRAVAPKEVWSVQLAFDRERTASVPAGSEYGGILRFVDTGKSRMRTAVPMRAAAAGSAWAERAWPKGLWLATVGFDTATQVDAGRIDHEVPAGGAMTVRLPMLVHSATDLHLLQRVEIVSDTNGVTQLLAGGVALPAGWSFVRRISSVQLPTDLPVIATASGEDVAASEFRRRAEFAFTVGTDSKVNPYYHARHPQHDGLDATFNAPAPSGDDFQNYRYEVKPELFSIQNRIVFEWDKDDSTAWNPNKALSGTCSWYLGNLVKEGELRLRGKFVMQRISDQDVKLK